MTYIKNLPSSLLFYNSAKNNMYVEVTATGKFEYKLNYTVYSPYKYYHACLFRDYAELEMADPWFPAVYFRGPFVCYNFLEDRKFADNSRYKYIIYMRDLHNPKDQVYSLEVIRNDGVVVCPCHRFLQQRLQAVSAFLLRNGVFLKTGAGCHADYFP